MNFSATIKNNELQGTDTDTSFSNCLQVGFKVANFLPRVPSQKRTTCSGLMKTALNNVVLPTLFNVVNNIDQHC